MPSDLRVLRPVQFNLKLTADELERYRALAKRLGVTVSGLLRLGVTKLEGSWMEPTADQAVGE